MLVMNWRNGAGEGIDVPGGKGRWPGGMIL